ncbi:riboflavin kinase, partial [Patulibacter sp. S7RM1-6]
MTDTAIAPTEPAARRRLAGVVRDGRRLGRRLGFPTANLPLPADGDWAFGVYAARVDGWPAAVSIGVRPTVGNGLRPLVEAHLLDWSGDLYGRRIEVELVRFLRPERSFSGLEELRAAIERDVRAVREVVGAPDRAGRPAAVGTADAPAEAV